MSRKERWLLAAEMWWMTGNVWESGGFPRYADDHMMWECLFEWVWAPL